MKNKLKIKKTLFSETYEFSSVDTVYRSTQTCVTANRYHVAGQFAGLTRFVSASTLEEKRMLYALNKGNSVWWILGMHPVSCLAEGGMS